MNVRLPMFFAVAVASRAAAADSYWATVPADPAARRIETLVVASAPGEETVRLLNGDVPAPQPPPEAGRVVAIDIGLQSGPPLEAGKGGAAEATPIPDNAIWPSPDGKIAEVVVGAEADAAKAGIRNPWAVRVHASPASHDVSFFCGGVIDGGPGGPVALLNGHIVTSGATVSGFRVAQIASGAAIVGLRGVSYVLPVGRHVVIETAGD